MKVETNRAVLAIGFFSSILVAIWATSSGSLWIDEFGTWLLTRADSIPDWWRRFQSWPDSIPKYHYTIFICMDGRKSLAQILLQCEHRTSGCL